MYLLLHTKYHKDEKWSYLKWSDVQYKWLKGEDICTVSFMEIRILVEFRFVWKVYLAMCSPKFYPELTKQTEECYSEELAVLSTLWSVYIWKPFWFEGLSWQSTLLKQQNIAFFCGWIYFENIKDITNVVDMVAASRFVNS